MDMQKLAQLLDEAEAGDLLACADLATQAPALGRRVVALEAELARRGQGVQVKPLEWKEVPTGGVWRAVSVLGEYSVGFDDGWWAALEGYDPWEWEPPEDPRCYSGPEAGMNACKLHCEARIRAALVSPDPDPEHPDDLAVDRFAASMKGKLARKRLQGRGGWEGPTCTAELLSRLLREHVEKGDPLDVGNLAMMLHQRGERIVSPGEVTPELARLRNLIAGLDHDHFGLQARVVALKAEALREGGA